ncbi:DUF1638 domain-containing protein [Sporomusa acidovorans]|uniref:DUF1638 domain-containing protein n=1 Tax=Sporomusa acidovorans TaxID=112900 RepID=UPI0008806803|nr:DUF1638 domain-containing protein [Sporomusa acidovorans]OZC22138.1 hypothetical protein SPACI_15850 [Sporomusa acidovorans DSM 3132]SDF82656.1 Protein of unknown function [Sporomusa acidovorans]
MNKTKIIACRTLEAEIMAVLPKDIDYDFLEYGLHNTPDKLRVKLQECIDKSKEYETLLFGYGLCSNGVLGLKTPKQTMVFPRVHDCISLLLGSRAHYDKEFKQFPATYYLSKGWIKEKGDPLSSFYRYCDKYGETKARWFMEEQYRNYQRIVFIHTIDNCKEEVEYSREVARFLNVEHYEIVGELDYFRGLFKGNWGEEFLVIPPGKDASLFHFI